MSSDSTSPLAPLSGEEPAAAPFGKYRLVQRVAAGGMAQVFLASLDGPDGFSKPLAIKRILPEFASLEDFSRMFVGEARIAALLHHPNIVQVYEFGKIDGQYFLAMEWVNGASLDRIIRAAKQHNVPLGPRAAVQIGIPIADALAYTHAFALPDGTPLGLVHRDVTPGNILVSRTGQVKLTDFGVVKSDVNVDATAVGVVKGKYTYMAPEQVAGAQVDARADIFSLGVVLYELSTGTRLFKRETVAATISAVTLGQIPPPTRLVPGFPPAFEGILLRMLASDPNARYAQMTDVLADLEAFRVAQSWTTSGRELSGLMSLLFPRGVTTGAGSVNGLSEPSWPMTQAGVTGSGASRSGHPVVEPLLPEVDVVEPDEKSEERLRGPVVAAAVAIAVLGTAAFWLLVG